MVVAVDVGNTNIHIGWYRNEKLVRYCRTPNRLKSFRSLLDCRKNPPAANVEGGVIVSVVPALTGDIAGVLARRYRRRPLIVTAARARHLDYGYRHPASIGADRVAVVAGGLARYRTDLLIVDFGTATTIDVALRNGSYPGGLIMPGIETGHRALISRTSLKKTALVKPAALIGRSTGECISSGIINGHCHMVGSLIRRIKMQYRREFLCIATGGWGRLMSSMIDDIDSFDRDLALYGAVRIFQDQKKCR